MEWRCLRSTKSWITAFLLYRFSSSLSLQLGRIRSEMADIISRWTKLSRPLSWFLGLGVSFGLIILYIVSRTEVHTFDALSYTWALEDKPFGLLFHPHHLFYGPLGWLAYKSAQLLGYGGHADLPIQIVNALAGAFGVFLMWRFGARWTGRSIGALGVALLMGISYAYWLYATEVEVYTLATAFLVLALWIMTRLDERPHVRWAVALGLAHTGAIMFHQTNLLFGLAILTFLLSRPNLRRSSLIFAYGLAVLIPLIFSYGYVAYASRFPDLRGFYNWFTDYAQSGQWGGFLSFSHFPALRSGLQLTVSLQPGLAAVFYLLTAVGIVAGIYQARFDAHHRAWILFALVWTVSYLLFFWWWEPWNIEFWIALLPLWGLWILSAGPSKESYQESDGKPPLNPRTLLLILYAFIPFLLSFQLYRAHYDPIQEVGDVNNDYYRQVTNELVAVVGPEELVVTRGNILDLYIPFYAEHPHILSMRQVEQQKAGDRSQIMGEILGQLDYAMVTGRPFLIDQFILDEERDPISNPFGLLPGEIETIKNRYPLQPVAYRGEQPLFYGTPRFDNFGRTQWDFNDSLGGWGTWGIESPHFADGGWCFTSGVDPQMKGPIINIEAEKWPVLSLDITLEADASRAQIFWRTPDKDYSLDNSLEFPLQRGQQLYKITMEDEPSWQGTIAQIRIDPLPGNEDDQPEIMACVHSIRFLPTE